MANALNVYVHQRPVGELFLEGGKTVFRYHSSVNAEDFVSLTMPVRGRDYVHDHLFPLFEMHLPEGYLLSVIKRHFSKLATTDDFGLLKLLAPSVEGRLSYASSQLPFDTLSLDELLQATGERTLFDELVTRFALRSPLSGVQPKVLAHLQGKAALQLGSYIVKAWGTDYPQLALNEYWCMRVLQAAKIPVPEFYLSSDAALFVMKRFDLTADGCALGFEDMCVLQARQRDDKYAGSYEQVAKTIKTFVAPATKAAALAQYFKMIVLNQLLQNGDAHLKNFGLVYEGVDSVCLAPAYDVVSTTAYLQNDLSALTMMGSRKWWTRKHLLQFGASACDLTLKEASVLYDDCLQAIAQIESEVSAACLSESDADARHVLEHLLGLMRKAI
ncbi:MAG: type II toxin-antitoxin system HipA family toxin [Pseudomonadales bacterium]